MMLFQRDMQPAWEKLWGTVDPLLTELGYTHEREEAGTVRFATLERRICAALSRLKELDERAPVSKQPGLGWCVQIGDKTVVCGSREKAVEAWRRGA